VVGLKYRVDITRDESGTWLVRVPAVPGCHTYGRTLEQARRRIREALELWVPGAEEADLEYRVLLPADIRAELQRARSARKRSARAQRDAHDATVNAARDLTQRLGLSLRDTSELLELSHQRVQQLVSG
jgi:predicted RNase H-like HicB family nuclease